ncbi:DeoR/GlpR family DNA-binding transcription regulator [Amycolatopsis rubida]|uniref:DeoR family transcriptional regulator, fructose operon transcriptional repressor n=1 Tax=Amycolatopsis rubida TaxID=112413 RepID=A0A1I5XK83_9PSEU|nr:DeoR/GlpR family DNA-binding transcription regulator [Amycolatopsis rubida]SFQ32087.1 DeoR family transcriptional regulator, fructose operon transcriptional repressor [Amycolatopsis rubida]
MAETERRKSAPARAKDRRRALLDLAAASEGGFANVTGLARELNVHHTTLYRDLAELAKAGLIARDRGRFVRAAPESAVDVPYSVRSTENTPVKKALARAAAAMAADGQTVVLDSGSTMYHLAAALRERDGLSVVTNDLMVATRSAGHPTNRLHVTGGSVIDTVYTLVGPDTVAALENMHADLAFLGAEAVHDQAGVTNVNVIEVAVKQAMIAAADRVVLVADSSKFGLRSLAPVCPLSAFDAILTDDDLAAEDRGRYGPGLRIVQSNPHTSRR